MRPVGDGAKRPFVIRVQNYDFFVNYVVCLQKKA
jgi:hypothetical protein